MFDFQKNNLSFTKMSEKQNLLFLIFKSISCSGKILSFVFYDEYFFIVE